MMSDVSLPDAQRIVITGVGLTAPGGSNTLADFREQVLAGRSGISTIDLRYMDSYPAGICEFPEAKYRKKKDNKRGTRAGCIGVYCAGEALADAGIDFS
ncbi:Beta-ketoacyl synthase, N-terminal domain, partial [Candidatus Electrothrix marina]